MLIIQDIEDTTQDELCLLYLLKYTNIDELYKSITKKRYFKDKVTAMGSIELSLGVKKKNVDYNQLRTLATEFRKLFKGKKGGSMGTIEACMLNLKEFKENYEYTDEEILKAAQNYINSELKNNYEYLQRADRVIKHIENGVPASKLLAFCDELDDDNGDEDWTESI